MIGINTHGNKIKCFEEEYLEKGRFMLRLSGHELCNVFDFEGIPEDDTLYDCVCEFIAIDEYFRFLQVDNRDTQDTVFNADDLRGTYHYFEII